MVWIAYLAVLVLAVAGLVALGRPRKIDPESYEAMRGKGNPLGNALLDVQILLEPGRESLRQVKEEVRSEEDDSGDPPDLPPRAP